MRLRLMSDVPLGAMLSGGLDSSLIVALMARNMSEPVKTFSVGFAEDGDDERARRRAARRERLRHRPPRARALGRRRRRSTSTSSSGTSTSRSPTSPSLGFLALSELAARHVTVALSGQGADELLGGYAKHRAAAARRDVAPRCRGPARGAATSLALARPGARPPRRLATLAAHELRRPPARDERPARRDAARAARPRPARAHATATRRGAPSPRGLDGVAGRPAAGDALPRRAARARRRHAPLLRPRVDGALARGARPVPRPPPGRVLRDDPGRPQGAAPARRSTCSSSAARGLVPDRIIDKREDRLLRRLASTAGSRPRRRRDRATTCSPRARATPSSSTARRSTQLVRAHARRCRRAARPAAARDPDARGLALVLPAAGAVTAPTSSSGSRARRDLSALSRTRSSRRRGTRRRTSRASPPASPRRPSPPASWVIVDNGSTDETRSRSLSGSPRAPSVDPAS